MVNYRVDFYDQASFPLSPPDPAPTPVPVELQNFYITVIDLDGNGSTFNEFVELSGFQSYIVDSTTKLGISAVGDGKTRFNGTTTSLPNIDFDRTAAVIVNFTAPVSSIALTIGTTGKLTDREFSINFGAAGGSFPNPQTILKAPILAVSNQTVSWDPILNATKYMVKIYNSGGTLIDTVDVGTGTSIDLSTRALATGSYYVEVQTKGNGTTYLDSGWSSKSAPNIAITVSIASVANITKTVAYGTSLASAKSALGTSVTVNLVGGGTATVPITWSADSTPTYSGNTSATYVFTGTFGTLPANVDNKNTVSAPSGTVTVDTVSIASVSNITKTVAYGTSLADAKAALGTSVTVNLVGGGTATVPVTWSADSTPTYNGNTSAAYVFTSTFGTLPANVDNKNTVSAPSGTVTVDTVSIASVSNITKTVAYGTTITDAKAALGTSVTVNLVGGGTATVDVTWSADSNPTYVGTTA
ncbi:Ig-like domain-containing protein, partial [Paenibacillus koleovorans]|uniref:Ig-like domain-containing protein n=1 Tax=Paenibacillus koleovorans TaxID=121608 RepID=UPI0013E2AC68